MRVRSLTDANNPFLVVARDRPTPEAMSTQTILVTGAGASTAKDGWLIVNSGDGYRRRQRIGGALLDHHCSSAAR